VRDQFLEPRHLRQWLEIIQRLPTSPPTSPAPASPAA
jgi:hypothetical protein